MSYRRGFQLCKIYRLKCIGAHMLKLKNNLKPIKDGGYYFYSTLHFQALENYFY